ncbi:MAG: UDP-N-acetylmuramate--L-alanine ligase [Planctomycetes bacterium]|nr:UDP-N-acetylmuramate--L-alanine ligase [Planctomycetota bacterium]
MNIHLIGIGGIGMSGLARCLAAQGHTLTGSDLKPNALTESLGIPVAVGHDPKNVAGAELVVRSAAVRDDNPEVVAARERNIEVVKYAQMLGRLTQDRAGIAVAGCHGKTTTSSMSAYVLSRAGFEPGFVIGGVVPQLGSNAALGKGRHFVTEACEYDRSFHNLSPRCAVITNVEEDHLDYYRDLAEITQAYREFAARASEIVIGSLDNAGSASIVVERKGRDEAYSIERDADWRARNVEVKDGRWTFEIVKYGKPFGEFQISVPGIHNVSNALAATAAATWAGVGREIIQVALSEFAGAARRFQLVGERGGVPVVDDYGHHPTEVQATLRAARERYPERKIWCVFQPHQRARTRILLKEFAKAFSDASLVLLPEIYEARDEESKAISSADLAKLLDQNGKAALFLPTFDSVVEFLREKAPPDCLVVTMGAGNVDEVARRFLAR